MMKLKESKLRQLIKEVIWDSDILNAYYRIANLLPIDCYVFQTYNTIEIFNNSDLPGNQRIFLQRGKYIFENKLYFAGRGFNAVSDDWIIKQAYCQSFDEMDQLIKNAVETILEDGIAILKDDANVDVDLT